MGMGTTGAGNAFGAVPADFGLRPLTLQYTLGTNSSNFPKDLLPRAEWKEGAWDLDVLALVYLPEFMKTDWSTLPLGNDLLMWQSSNAKDAEDFVLGEIEHLRELMQTDRERYMAEIVFQHDNAPGYWSALLALNPGQNKHSLILINLAVRIGQIVAAHYKWQYKRTRPSYVCPGLLPPFGPPSHAAFPSGHSMQSWLLTGLLSQVAPSFKEQLEWLAERVAVNRERAGVHYRRIPVPASSSPTSA